ncbi:MAG: cupin domain-containing protein [Pseudomonadota bacterium]
MPSPQILDRLFQPMPANDFMSQVWEKRYHHACRADDRYFADLAGDVNLGEQIWRAQGSWAGFSLGRSRTSPRECAYLSQPLTEGAVRAALREGYTLVVNDVQNASATAARLCRAMEAAFCARANANLYLTPAGCQGLDAHYDDQDVFVLQLEGAKVWHLYDDAGRALPLDDEAYQAPDLEGRTPTRVALAPGDVLYVPRGIVHEAHTEHSSSLHMTISVSSIRWASFVARLCDTIARSEPSLRRAIPPAVLRGDVPITGRHWDDLLSVLLPNLTEPAMAGQALGALRSQVMGSMRRLPSADSAILPPRGAVQAERFRIAPDQVWFLTVGDGVLNLSFIGADMTMPSRFEPLVRRICDGQPVDVETLSAGEPHDQIRRLLDQLVAAGLLVAC